MIVSLAFAIILSIIHYTIRDKISQQSKKEKQKDIFGKNPFERMDFEHYKSFFDKDALCDNSPEGLTESKLISFIKQKNPKHLNIYSINGISKNCYDLLDYLSLDFSVHSLQEITEIIGKENLPKQCYYLSPQRAKSAIKYGVILAVCSIFTPYKFYYAIVSALFFLAGILSLILSISQQNRIPYHRS